MSNAYGNYDSFDDIQVEDTFPEPEGIAEAAAYFAELNHNDFEEMSEPNEDWGWRRLENYHNDYSDPF